MEIFNAADILLPRADALARWSVIACDQFTAQREYWEEAERLVGAAPSALRLVLPEAWLDTPRAQGAEGRIRQSMEAYLAGDVFTVLPDSFVYVERTQTDGQVRRGLVGALDLESYDFAPGSAAPVRATEDTVAQRLPPRVRVRQQALLELPHVMVLMDDRDERVLGPLTEEKLALPPAYDFELMLGGGHIRGWQVAGDAAARVSAALSSLADGTLLREKYGSSDAPLVFAVGDGNHSLAAAKLCWESVKGGLPARERARHPARFALAELVNVHEPAVAFAPIHRLLRGTESEAFLAEAAGRFGMTAAGESHRIRCLTAAGERSFALYGTMGEVIGACEEFCLEYLRRHGGVIDYIHGDEAAEALGRERGNCALLLPAMDKTELFTSVLKSGAFPRKSFSIGQARDKRYYLESRKLF